MSNRALKFGDIVRVDPANKKVKQPDPRRWMVLVRASTMARYPWTLMFLGPTSPANDRISISHWPSLIGFLVVDDE